MLRKKQTVRFFVCFFQTKQTDISEPSSKKSKTNIFFSYMKKKQTALIQLKVICGKMLKKHQNTFEKTAIFCLTFKN